jgi:drug/metabolite transporter (DMT)-like permease
MLISSAWFACMAASVKALATSLPTAEIVFFRCLLPLPYLVWLARDRGARLIAADRALIALRCLLGSGAMALYFYALGRLPLGEVILLGKTQPVFVALFAPFLLGERAGVAVVAALGASLVGAVLIAQPGLALGDPVGALMLLAALLSALSHMAIRRLTESEDPATVVLDFTIFVAIGSCLIGGSDFVLPEAGHAPALLGVAGFATLGQLFMTHAYQADEAPGVSAAGYASVVFSMALGWLFWSEVPSGAAWAGGGLVVGSGMLLLWTRK